MTYCPHGVSGCCHTRTGKLWCCWLVLQQWSQNTKDPAGLLDACVGCAVLMVWNFLWTRHLISFGLFLDKLSSSNWLQTHIVAKYDLEFQILCCPPPNYWNYRCVSNTHPVYVALGIKTKGLTLCFLSYTSWCHYLEMFRTYAFKIVHTKCFWAPFHTSFHFGCWRIQIRLSWGSCPQGFID